MEPGGTGGAGVEWRPRCGGCRAFRAKSSLTSRDAPDFFRRVVDVVE